MITNYQNYPLQQQETNRQKDKIQQREAVENFYDNFVEPQLKTQIQVQPQPMQHYVIAPTSPSLLLAVLIWFLCLGIHIRYLKHKSQNKSRAIAHIMFIQ